MTSPESNTTDTGTEGRPALAERVPGRALALDHMRQMVAFFADHPEIGTPYGVDVNTHLVGGWPEIERFAKANDYTLPKSRVGQAVAYIDIMVRDQFRVTHWVFGRDA